MTMHGCANSGPARAATRGGYRVIDREFSEEHRYDPVVMAAWRADARALKLLPKKTRAGVLIVGEAFSQRLGADAPELRENGMVSCCARIELRAVAKATNEVLATDAAQAGGVDLTEEIAGKVALERAAEEVGKRLVDKLMYLPARPTRYVSVVISGVDGATKADRIRAQVAALPGVRRVEQDDLTEATLYLDVELDSLTAQDFAGKLERSAGGRLRVRDVSKLMVSAQWED